VDLELLLALADQERHGYGLVQAITEHTGGLVVLDPGNLYRVIKRLLAEGLKTGPTYLLTAGSKDPAYVRTRGPVCCSLAACFEQFLSLPFVLRA
jgi:hypothetical protein